GTTLPCRARKRIRSASGSDAISGVRWESEATGPVSVIPQPWSISTPTTRLNRSISEAGTDDPHAVIRRIEERSRGFCSSQFSRPIHTVGTPAVTVTCSPSISSASEPGSALNCPANTSFEPAIAAAYGVPHALAWNIGTTGSTASRSVRPRHDARLIIIECRYCDRWEYTTPFGSPVVPDV